jgi:hypothetical protein
MLSVLKPKGVVIITLYSTFLTLTLLLYLGLSIATSDGGSTSAQDSFSSYPETYEEFMHRCQAYKREHDSSSLDLQLFSECRQEWKNR